LIGRWETPLNPKPCGRTESGMTAVLASAEAPPDWAVGDTPASLDTVSVLPPVVERPPELEVGEERGGEQGLGFGLWG